MLLYIYFCLIGFSFSGIYGQDYQFIEEKDGISLYSKVNIETGEEWTKLVGVIDASMEEITQYTGTVNNLTSWVYACDKVELINKKENETIYYLISDMPYPMTDRDIIIKRTVSTDEIRGITKSVSINYTDVERDSELVRIPRFKTIWVFEQLPSGKTKVTYEVSADPGGSIPNWVKDRFAYYGPLKTFENLRNRF